MNLKIAKCVYGKNCVNKKKRRMKLQELTEHEIQTQVINYLGYNGFYCMRLNSGKIRSSDKYGKSRMINLAPVGTPDLQAFRKKGDGVQLYFFEIKRPGRKATWHQEQKMKELEEFGARCLVVTSIEDLERQLNLKHL